MNEEQVPPLENRDTLYKHIKVLLAGSKYFITGAYSKEQRRNLDYSET